MSDDDFDSPETNRTPPATLPTVPLWRAHTTQGTTPAKLGAPRLFETPEQLLVACHEYFEWVENHPLYESESFHYQGSITVHAKPKMRAMTIVGLCLFLQISRETWYDWKKTRKELADIITHVEHSIWEQKVSGAAADLLNANIIAREVGLAEHSKVNATVENKTDLSDLDDTELAAVHSILLSAAKRKEEPNVGDR